MLSKLTRSHTHRSQLHPPALVERSPPLCPVSTPPPVPEPHRRVPHLARDPRREQGRRARERRGVVGPAGAFRSGLLSVAQTPFKGESDRLLICLENIAQLERSLMEGSYSRVWSLCRPSSSSASLPLPEFSHFTPTLLQTVRNEIAACDERAYESLPVRDARTLLFFESDQEVQAFAQSVRPSFAAGRDRALLFFPLVFPNPSTIACCSVAGTKNCIPKFCVQRNWYLDPSTSILHFPSSSRHPSRLAPTQGVPVGGMATGLIGGGGGPDDDSRELDRAKVVAATLKYARELESIV